MNDIKLIIMVDDETWFWIWNDETRLWEAFYEVDHTPAVRATFSDRPLIENVLEQMKHIVNGTRPFLIID